MVLAMSSSNFDCTIWVVVERLEELDELVALVELELLFYFVGIPETMKGYDGFFI